MEFCNAKYHQMEHRMVMDQEGEDVKIGFQPLTPENINITTEQVKMGPVDPSTHVEQEHPMFSQRPNTNLAEFNSQHKIQWLTSKFNLGESPVNMGITKPACTLNL